MNADGNASRLVVKVGEEPSPLIAPGSSGLRIKPAASPLKNKQQSDSRFAVLNNFCDMTMRKLTRAEIVIWMLLFRDTKREGVARTAQTDLARRAGVKTRTVERAVSSLERHGLLEVVRRGGLQKGLSIYRVHALTRESSSKPPPYGPDTEVGL